MEFVEDVSAPSIRQSIGSFLSDQNVSKLMDAGQVVRYHIGEYLFREGQPHGDLYVLLDGIVTLVMTIPGRGPQRILTVGSGELLAWSAMVGSSNHPCNLYRSTPISATTSTTTAPTMTCDAVSATTTTLLRINGQALKDIFNTEPQFGFEFMQWLASGLAKRLTATRLQMLDLFARENPR